MAKKRKRRSAIVPAIVLSASLAGGVSVVPVIVTGCNSTGVPNTSVAADGFHASVAADGFQPSVAVDGFQNGVAVDGFQNGVADLSFSVAADFAQPPVGLDVAAADFTTPFSVANGGFDMSGEG